MTLCQGTLQCWHCTPMSLCACCVPWASLVWAGNLTCPGHTRNSNEAKSKDGKPPSAELWSPAVQTEPGQHSATPRDLERLREEGSRQAGQHVQTARGRAVWLSSRVEQGCGVRLHRSQVQKQSHCAGEKPAEPASAWGGTADPACHPLLCAAESCFHKHERCLLAFPATQAELPWARWGWAGLGVGHRAIAETQGAPARPPMATFVLASTSSSSLSRGSRDELPGSGQGRHGRDSSAVRSCDRGDRDRELRGVEWVLWCWWVLQECSGRAQGPCP